MWSEETIICTMALNKLSPQIYTIRKPLQHLRKLVLASIVERLSISNAVHLVHFSLLQIIQSNLVSFGLFWSNLVHFGLFGPFLSILDSSVHPINFSLFRSISVYISLFRSIQSVLIHFGPIQYTSVHFGPCWSISVQISIWSIQFITLHFSPFHSNSIYFSPIQSISVHFSPLQSIRSILL